MRIPLPFALILAVGFLPFAAPGAALADDPKPADPAAAMAAPGMATVEQAKAAIEAFKKAFKDPDVTLKVQALSDLSKTQHPLATLELAKRLADKNLDVKTMAASYLGDQKALPGLAGQKLVASFDANTTDWIFLLGAVDSITSLGYRGSLPALLKLLKHKTPSVVNAALVTLGDMKEMRALDTLIEMLKGTKVDAGASWEGGEVKVDTGDPGTKDQEAAEALYREKYGSNKGKAAAGRKFRDIGEVILLTLKDLTGVQFSKSEQVRTWATEHKADIDAKKKALDEIQKKQDADAAAQLEWVKTQK